MRLGPGSAQPSHVTLSSTWLAFAMLFNGSLLSAWLLRFLSYGSSYAKLEAFGLHLPMRDATTVFLALHLPSSLNELQYFAQHLWRLYESPATRRLAFAWSAALIVGAGTILGLVFVPPVREKLVGAVEDGEFVEAGVVFRGPLTELLLMTHGLVAVALLWKELPWHSWLQKGVQLACPWRLPQAWIEAPNARQSRKSVFGNVVLGIRGLLGLAMLSLLLTFFAMRDEVRKKFAWEVNMKLFYILTHVFFVVYCNFEHPFFVRMTLFVLNMTYMPGAAACIKQQQQNSAATNIFGEGFFYFTSFYTFGYIVIVPVLQFCTLKTIQRAAISDLLTWPGRRARRSKSVMAKRYGTLYLRQQIHLDARLVGVTGERGLPQLPRLRGLTWTTLPFYYEVVVTIKKALIVLICSYMGGPDSGIVLQVLLGMILIMFLELLLATKPYFAVAPEDLADETPLSNRQMLLRSAVMLDCNQVERLGTFCLLVFLGCLPKIISVSPFLASISTFSVVFLSTLYLLCCRCASVFQERKCGESPDDEVCNSFDVLTFIIFLVAVGACLANPLRLGYLTLRERSRPRTHFFLSAAQGLEPSHVVVPLCSRTVVAPHCGTGRTIRQQETTLASCLR